MYKIIKILNNNTILVTKDEEELIIMYKGIGFVKKANEVIEIPTSAKKYLMQKGYTSKKSRGNFIDFVDPIFLEIAADILKEANLVFDYVNNDILLPLADHLFYAIKRMDENIMPVNPFTYDINLLFPEEYNVAKKGKEIIYNAINKTINEDEVGFITLHIHSAISNDKVTQSMEATQVIHDGIKQLEEELNISITSKSISYVRLMNHIKYLIIRINNNEALEMDISEYTRERFPFAYNYATKLCQSLSQALDKQLPNNEIGYLALHIERILSDTIK